MLFIYKGITNTCQIYRKAFGSTLWGPSSFQKISRNIHLFGGMRFPVEGDSYHNQMIINSHAWGRAPRRPRDFKFVFGMFLVDRSLRTTMFIPVNKSFTTYVLVRFRRKFNRAERQRISHRPICEFRPKIEFYWPQKFKMTLKISETIM